MFFKTIIQGRLEFGTQKTYDKVVKMYLYRAENYHKNDLIFKEIEEIFFPEELVMNIPRFVGQSSEKHFKNTASLLSYCGQFALTGTVQAWLVDQGKILHYTKVEPSSDKAVVQSYLKGKKLVKVDGKEEEAIKALTKAIEKYDRHAQAYERRAKVNFILKKYAEAIRDYNKSLSIDAKNPHAYFGRAKAYLQKEDYEQAIEDFDMALKTSVALQDLYWKSRRLKSKAHIIRKEWAKAEFDLKLFTNRKFKKDNPNFIWKRSALIQYANVLKELEKYDLALKAIEEASQIERPKEDKILEGEILRYRGLIKQKAGKKGYLKDLKDAVEKGDKPAANLLKQFS